MRIIVKLLVAIAALSASGTMVSCKDVIIGSEELPAAAQSFLEDYFPGNPVSYAKKDREFAKTSYEVVLRDGTEVEFDAKGQWDNVDCKKSAVPAALIPTSVADYVQTNFPDQLIVKIDREPYGHEIELLSGLELKFGKKGDLINIDD